LDSIPIIDLAPFLDGSARAGAGTVRAIGEACRATGFFYAVNHGIATARVFAAAERFFALPLASKEALSITQAADNRGYVALRSEQLDPSAPADCKEAFNLGPERAHARNRWPDLPDFRDPSLAYLTAATALAQRLHDAFAIDLGLAPTHFAGLVDRPSVTLRLLHYPPGQRAALGAGAHTDYGTITLLAQDEVGGLEVRTRSGEWIAAPPIPSAFVCNIGDLLMRWTNDVYASTPHRVVSPPGRERYAIALFFDPNPDAIIACLPTCADASRPARYPPIRADDYLRSRLDSTYAHRGAIA
jgi:isopenicillin N synthase-like dioxygenase